MKTVSNVLVGFKGQVKRGVTVAKTYLINEDLVFIDDDGRNRDARVFVWNLSLEKCEGILGLNNINHADYMSEGAPVPDLKDDDREEFILPTPPSRQEVIEASKCFGTQEDGSHYTDMQLQPLQACYLRYGLEGLRAAIHTKVDKYISRKKNDDIVQLKKANHCLSILVEIAEIEKDLT